MDPIILHDPLAACFRITSIADITASPFLINPYNLISGLGAEILILLEVNRKKRELS